MTQTTEALTQELGHDESADLASTIRAVLAALPSAPGALDAALRQRWEQAADDLEG